MPQPGRTLDKLPPQDLNAGSHSRLQKIRAPLWLAAALLFFLAGSATAVTGAIPGIASGRTGGGQTLTLDFQTLLMLGAIAFIPALVLVMTAFTRVAIVLAILRQAIGTPHIPPNAVLLGLALVLTFFIMTPVFDKVYRDAWIPYGENRIELPQALEIGAGPLKQFMLKQTRKTDLEMFVKLSQRGPFHDVNSIPLRIVLPAFITSELRTAFQIGFMIFVPFLIIDLVVASVLMSMGMIMFPPMLVSLPFKLLLFVLVDGWALLVGSLVQSF